MDINDARILIRETVGPIGNIIYNYDVGKFKDVEQSVVQKIKAIIAKHSFIKIGRSNDPNDRFKTEYEPKGFIGMYVFYRSESIEEVKSSEERMIDVFIDDKKTLNLIKGSAGPEGEEPPHYLYVAVADVVTPDIFEWYKAKIEKVMDELKSALKKAQESKKELIGK